MVVPVCLMLLVTLLGSVPYVAAVTHAGVLAQARQTVDLIYNMQFAEAIQAAQALIELAPHHPAGRFYRAATYWQWRLMARDARQREVLLKHFSTASREALDRAERLLPTQATEAAFYLGATYGMQARMYFVQKQYVKALQAAKQGSTYLQRCVANDPTWYDAYAGLGTYHYVLSRVPSFWRGIVQQLIGIGGDRDQGLHELHQARTHGPLSSPEAASLLAKIYALPEEGHYRQAASLLEALVERYPNNFDYRYRLAYLCTLLGQWERAQQLHRVLIADVEHGKPYYDLQCLPLLRYRLAETLMFAGNHQEAMALFSALQQQELDTTLRAWITLRRGNLHDVRGERQAAQAWYEQVDGDSVATHLARQSLATPFTPGQATLKPPEQVI